MNLKALVLFLCASAPALAGEGQSPPAASEKAVALVAKIKLTRGWTIKHPENFFVEKEFAKSQVPTNAVPRDVRALRGLRLNRALAAGEILTTADLSYSGDPPDRRYCQTVMLLMNDEVLDVPANSRVDIELAAREGKAGVGVTVILHNVVFLRAQPLANRDRWARIRLVFATRFLALKTNLGEFQPLAFVALEVTNEQARWIDKAGGLSAKGRLIARHILPPFPIFP